MSLFDNPVANAKKGHLSSLVLLGLADGKLDPTELDMIVKTGLHIGLSEAEIRQILDDPTKHALKVPKSEKLRLTLLYDHVLLMLVDGKIDPKERDFCQKMARGMGFNPEEVIPKILADLAKPSTESTRQTPPIPSPASGSASPSPGITIDSDAFLSDRNDASSPDPNKARPTPSTTRIRIRKVDSRADEIRVEDFAVSIPEGEKTSDDYFLLNHNQHYSICLRNYSGRRCDADLEIDGKDMGTFRVPVNSSGTFDRPAHEDGRFTFYELMSQEGNAVGLKANQNLGLIRVTFRPELVNTALFAARPRLESLAMGAPAETIPRAGGTALTGTSSQTFSDAERIEYDSHAAVIIHLRLGARIVSRPSEPRPLTSHPRSNKIPPPLS